MQIRELNIRKQQRNVTSQIKIILLNIIKNENSYYYSISIYWITDNLYSIDFL